MNPPHNPQPRPDETEDTKPVRESESEQKSLAKETSSASSTRGHASLAWLRKVDERLDQRGHLALVTLLLIAVFLPMGLLRLIDGDEGYLLYAARLVSEGKLLYRDAFFQQMPLIPWAYGGLYAITGPGWYSARLFSVAVAVGIGLFVYGIALLQTRHRWWSAFAVVLYAGCGLSLAWLPIVKTYGLPTLCLCAGCYLVLRGGKQGAFWAGTLTILSSAGRLYFGPVGLVFCLYVMRRDGFSRKGFQELGKLALGAVFGLCLLAPAVLPDPQAFWFDNFTFIGMRTYGQTDLLGSFEFKRGVLYTMFPIVASDGGASVQFVGLFVFGIAALLSRLVPKNSLCGPMWLSLGVLNLLPNPTFPQYSCVLIPFLAVEAVRFLKTLEFRAIDRALVGSLAFYLVLGAFDLYRFTATGYMVIALNPYQPRQAWLISTAQEVAKRVDEVSSGTVAGTWPGYYLTAKTPVIQGHSNDFGRLAAERLTKEQRIRYHVLSAADQLEIIAQHRTSVYVTGNWSPPLSAPLLAAGYVASPPIANATVWYLPKPAQP